MKKTAILATAVATALMAGAAAAESSVYGNIRLNIQSQDQLALESGKLIVGFKGSEDLGNGMAAIYHIEMEHDRADNETGGQTWTNDLSFVGLKGDFGQVTLGVQDDAASFACGQTDIFISNTGVICGAAASNGPLDNAIVYANTFGDLTFVGGITLDGDLTATTPSIASDGSNPAPGNHTVVALSYAAGDLQVGFQLTSPDSDLNIDDWMVVGGSYTMDQFTVGFTLADDGNETGTDLTVAIAGVAGGTIKAGIQSGEDLIGRDIVNVQYDRNLSKKVYTGVQYSSVDNAAGSDPDDLIQAYLGMKF
jgi:predicted porin